MSITSARGDGKFTRNDETRAAIWAHLVVYPGLTANEIQRAVLRNRSGNATINLCRRMERNGQLIGRSKFRPQQGREVTCWYAAPGAFAIGPLPRPPAGDETRECPRDV